MIEFSIGGLHFGVLLPVWVKTLEVQDFFLGAPLFSISTFSITCIYHGCNIGIKFKNIQLKVVIMKMDPTVEFH